MADHRPAAAGPVCPTAHRAVFARFAIALTRLLQRRAQQAGQGA